MPRYQSLGARRTAEDIIQRSERAAAPDLRFATARRAVRPRPTGPRDRGGTGRAPAGRGGAPWRSLRPARRCSRYPGRAHRPTLSPGTAARAFAARRWDRAAGSTTRGSTTGDLHRGVVTRPRDDEIGGVDVAERVGDGDANLRR